MLLQWSLIQIHKQNYVSLSFVSISCNVIAICLYDRHHFHHLDRPKETTFIIVTSDNRISIVLFNTFKKNEDSKTKIKSLKGKYEFKSLLP